MPEVRRLYMVIIDNVLLKLREIKESLTPAEKKVAEYVLAYPEEVPRYSVSKLASRSKTSDASVIRLCKTLGYDGYRQFIVSISAELASRGQEGGEEYTDIQPGDDINLIIKNVSLNNCKSIEDTLMVIDKNAIKEAVGLLSSARRIFFYGIGASGLVCMDAQQKFMRINKICYAYTDGHSLLTSASLLTKGDVAVVVSNTGTTAEIVDTLKLIKDANTPIIAITRYGKSILSSHADTVLYFSTPETTIRSGAMGSRIAMLNIIDILFSGVASLEYKTIKKYLDKTHNVLMDKHVN
jgi:Transcriptional regulators